MQNLIIIRPRWTYIFRDAQGRILHKEVVANLMVTAGKTYIGTSAFTGATQSSSWFIGLTSPTPVVAPTDTMASHSGWSEIVAYSETTRRSWVNGGSMVGLKLTNSASVARFTINQDSTTIGGAFLCNNSTKGGTTGTLISGSALSSGNRLLNTFGTLDLIVEYQF